MDDSQVMDFVKTDEGYVNVKQIIRVDDRGDGTATVEWFDGTQTREAITSFNRGTFSYQWYLPCIEIRTKGARNE